MTFSAPGLFEQLLVMLQTKLLKMEVCSGAAVPTAACRGRSPPLE